MNSLSQALQKVQAEVIGLFKNRMSKQTEMVLSAEKNGMVKTIRVGELGGLSTNHYSYELIDKYGKLVIFPDNKNLYEMAYGDALAFHDFIEKFNSES
jgi:hypothetical protein